MKKEPSVLINYIIIKKYFNNNQLIIITPKLLFRLN